MFHDRHKTDTLQQDSHSILKMKFPKFSDHIQNFSVAVPNHIQNYSPTYVTYNTMDLPNTGKQAANNQTSVENITIIMQLLKNTNDI